MLLLLLLPLLLLGRTFWNISSGNLIIAGTDGVVVSALDFVLCDGRSKDDDDDKYFFDVDMDDGVVNGLCVKIGNVLAVVRYGRGAAVSDIGINFETFCGGNFESLISSLSSSSSSSSSSYSS